MQCPYCQQQHPDDSLFCPVTGQRLNPSPGPALSGKAKHPFHLFSWTVIVFGLAGGLLFLGMLAINIWRKGIVPRLGSPAAATAVPAQAQNGSSSASGWVRMGPEGGDITTLVSDPTNPNRIYAGTTLAGVFQSEDGGASWVAASAGLQNTASLHILALVAAPRQQRVLYAATQGGLYQSTDGANSWQPLNGPASETGFRFETLAADPFKAGILYAARYSEGFFLSTDSGQTWSEHDVGAKADWPYFIAPDPGNQGVLYLGSSGGLFKSRDGGSTWSAIPLVEEDTSVYCLVFSPSPTSTLYAGTSEGVIKSTDSGQTWTQTGFTNAGVVSLALDPASPKSLVVSVPFDSPAVYPPSTAKHGLFFSIDGGDTWDKMKDKTPALDQVNWLGYLHSGLLAGTHQGVYQTEDLGGAWSVSNRGLTAIAVTSLAVDPSSFSTIYAAAGENGIFKSSDGGASWAAATAGLPQETISHLVLDPATPSTLYAWLADRPNYITHDFGELGLYKSTDGAATWKNIGAGVQSMDSVFALLVDPQDPTILYALTGEKVYKSLDGGDSWSEADEGVTANHDIYTFALAPSAPQVLYLATGKALFTSTDAAGHWVEVPTDLTVFSIGKIWVDPNDPKRLYASSNTNGQLLSIDGGGHWSEWQDPSDYHGLKVLALPPEGTLVGGGVLDFLGAGTLEATLTLTISRDRGESWNRADTGLSNLVLYSITLNPADPHEILLGTSQGIYSGSYTP